MVDSLSRPPRADAGGETWITASPEWVDHFGLARAAFEAAFRNLCVYAD